MSDSEPGSHGAHPEFDEPSGEGTDQQPTHKTWREGHARHDPGQTCRERAAGPGQGPGPAPLVDEQVIVSLPTALLHNYTVIRELPNPGSEADVLLVRDSGTASARSGRATADLKVVKIYRLGIRADHGVWAKVQTLRSGNIVQFIETGTSGGRDYEVMEYLPGGNLTQLAAKQSDALPLNMVTEVVRQVADALEELHGLGIVHGDLKPENVLVRQDQPLDIVVADFGLSRVPEQSVVAASRTGTLAYLPPETLLSRSAHSSKAWDWWALGVIVRELLTGVRPFEEMTDPAIHQALFLRPIDLGDIDDARARRLCHGLLLRDPTDRWGAEQVREWLAGGMPAVAEDAPNEAGEIKPFIFEKVPYRERKALAKAFARSWDQAARRYFAAMGTGPSSIAWRALREWLEQFRNPQADDVEGLYELIDDQLLPPSNPPDVKLLALIQWLDPNLSPVYRGQSLTRENLTAIAERVAFDQDPTGELGRLVGDLRRYNLLPRMERMRRGAGFTEGGGFTELDVAWRELEGRFRQQAQVVGPHLPAESQSILADENDIHRQAALLYIALDPAAHAPALRDHVTRNAALLPTPVQWYDQIRDYAEKHRNPLDDVALISLFPLASRASAAIDRDRRLREEATRQSQRHWEEHERQRLAGSPGAGRAVGYSAAVAGAMLALFIIVAVTGSGARWSVPDDIASALVGLVVASGIAISEGSLARQLGSDYPRYSPLARSGGGLRRVGYRIYARRGCLLLFVTFFVIPLSFSFPFVIYTIIGIVHWRSWQRRRNSWRAEHEADRREVFGNARPPEALAALRDEPPAGREPRERPEARPPRSSAWLAPGPGNAAASDDRTRNLAAGEGSNWGSVPREPAGPELPPVRYLTGDLPERAPVGRRISLLVRITLASQGSASAQLKELNVPGEGCDVTITVSAPDLVAVGDLEQDLHVPARADSEPVRFSFATGRAGLHSVMVRAFAGGTFLGELALEISVEVGAALEEGPSRTAALVGLAAEPGEVTLQVSRTDEDRYSFQLIADALYPVELTRRLAGDPTEVVSALVDELRAMAARTSPFATSALVRNRIKNLGAQLWADAVPEAIRQQFWAQADRIKLFTVASDMDTVPWELLYPVDGDNDNGFLVEQFPVVRRVYGQGRVRRLPLASAVYVVPPGSPGNAMDEVQAVRARLGGGIRDHGVVARLDSLTALLDDSPSVLHFACHNRFTGVSGSVVTLEGGPLRPSDLAVAVQTRSLVAASPLVFFNACRTAGEIQGLMQMMGWAKQFMGAGAGAFLGSLWPVRSDSARAFADAFYQALVTERAPLGVASLQARQAIAQDDGDPTWLAYTIYGNPSATIEDEVRT